MSGTARPLLVGSLGARDPAGAIADARALPEDVDLVEVRLDRFDDPAAVDLDALRRDLGRPAIATLRSVAEGGDFKGDAEAQTDLLSRAERAGFAWLDLEEPVAGRLPRRSARRVVAWHARDPVDDPSVGARRVRELAKLDADVVKVAATLTDPARALRFVLGASDAGRSVGVPVVAIPMGRHGRYLRPLAGRFHMPLLYAAAHPARRTAAGQLTVDDALRTYRATSVTPKTPVFAVLGADVAGSFSPAAHNATLDGLVSDGVYVSIDADDFDHAAVVARELPLAGLSVTAPHKATAHGFARELDPIASATGVANTLVRRDDGEYRGLNTDPAGFVAALRLACDDPAAARSVTVGHSLDPLLRLDGPDALDCGRLRPIRSALVYGTGDTARSIAHGLRSRRIRVTVTGRDQGAATRLAVALGRGIESVSQGRAAAIKADLLVKAIPDVVGRLPLDPNDFDPAGFAADVVYAPLDTDFLRVARQRGRTPVPGVLMFAEQAALQASLFLGVDVDAARPHIVTGISRALHRRT